MKRIESNEDISRIPFRIVCIFIILIFAGIYWVQVKLCPCDHTQIQMIAQYHYGGVFAEIGAGFVVLTGACILSCLGYSLMVTVLNLSLAHWGSKRADEDTESERKNNLKSFVITLMMIMVLVILIVVFIWIDVNTCEIVTESGYEKHSIFRSEYFSWAEMNEEEITEIFETRRFNHLTRAAELKYEDSSKFIYEILSRNN